MCHQALQNSPCVEGYLGLKRIDISNEATKLHASRPQTKLIDEACTCWSSQEAQQGHAQFSTAQVEDQRRSQFCITTHCVAAVIVHSGLISASLKNCGLRLSLPRFEDISCCASRRDRLCRYESVLRRAVEVRAPFQKREKIQTSLTITAQIHSRHGSGVHRCMHRSLESPKEQSYRTP